MFTGRRRLEAGAVVLFALGVAGVPVYALTHQPSGSVAQPQPAPTDFLPPSPSPTGPSPTGPSSSAEPTTRPAGGKAGSTAQLDAAAIERLKRHLDLDPAPKVAKRRTADFVVSSFNVLGSSHTKAHGAKSRMASGPLRAYWAGQVIRAGGAAVVGLQELQPNQVRPLVAGAGGNLVMYPGLAGPERRDSENSLAWRTSVWEVVRRSTFVIPYFHGRPRRMPVVLLRHRQSNVVVAFVNVHNPANTPQWGNNSAWRAEAVLIETRVVNRLVARGIPVVMTGDMNARDNFFCPIRAGTSLRAWNGGSYEAGRCTLPDDAGIDWIMGSAHVRFLQRARVRDAVIRQTTDHPVVWSRVRVSAAAG